MTAGGEHQPWSDEDFRPIAAIVRSRHGPSLPEHRLALMRARLRVRLESRAIPSFTWFHNHRLAGRPDGPDMQLVIDLSTVNHTSFFREIGTLEAVADGLAARIRQAGANTVRAWIAGCSAGQEPYSLAMLVAERVPLCSPSQFEILASDISMDVLEAAASGVYDARTVVAVDPNRLRRYFLKGRGRRHGSCRVVSEIRRLVEFRHFDLRANEWPVPRDLDAILCRNVLIYFNDSERLTILERMTDHLRIGGHLAVGSCEIFAERPRRLVKVAPSIFRKGGEQ